MEEQWNVLWVDWWTKYLWLAYWNARSGLISPIGYLMNDESLFFNLGDVFQRYKITEIVIGYPKQHEESQKKIDSLIQQMLFVEETLQIHKVDEEYSSVQASAKKWTYEKDSQEDTLAAMVLLENRQSDKEKSEKTS